MRQKVKKNASGAPEVFIYENECLYIFLFFFFLILKKGFQLSICIIYTQVKGWRKNLSKHLDRVKSIILK